jgi:CubicO group peptidase (beta-lactamase class C family)
MSNTEMYNYIVTKKPKAYLKPDTRFNYCNTNYAILALLVEKISGKPFNQFLKEELFIPLGMKHTSTINDIDLMSSNVTKPYNLKWKQVDLDASDYVLGDKSIYSTPYDLFLFSEGYFFKLIIFYQNEENEKKKKIILNLEYEKTLEVVQFESETSTYSFFSRPYVEGVFSRVYHVEAVMLTLYSASPRIWKETVGEDTFFFHEIVQEGPQPSF